MYKTFLITLFLFVSQHLFSQIFVIPMREEIGPTTSRQFASAMQQASNNKAALIIIDMNTYGGALKEADTICNLILQSKIPVWVYINSNAASAGALISLACDSIYMSPNAKIGAASVVNAEGELAPDKYQSYMRTLMRSMASAKHRNPQIAEAMVGKADRFGRYEVLSYTTQEALDNDFCEGQYHHLPALIKNYYNHASYTTYEPSTLDQFYSFFLNPFVKGILLLMILGGIYFELQSPGIGVAIAFAIIGMLGYFIPHYIHGFVSNWEIVLFIFGCLLIGIEIFLIPGFGVVGIIGFILAIGGLVLAALNNDYFDFTFVSKQDIAFALGSLFLSTTVVIALFFWLGDRLLDFKSFQKISLKTTFNAEAGYQVENKHLVGQIGIATTVLRPSGKVTIDQTMYDAYTSGEYIESNTPIIVVSQHTSTLKVRKYVTS
jgi:membrane-bound serine protease (ClpP class)